MVSRRSTASILSLALLLLLDFPGIVAVLHMALSPLPLPASASRHAAADQWGEVLFLAIAIADKAPELIRVPSARCVAGPFIDDAIPECWAVCMKLKTL